MDRFAQIALILLAGGCLLCGCTSQAGAQIPASDALRRDAEAYAAAQNVSVSEAVLRLRAQDPVGELQAVLLEQEPEAFAGLWIEHDPDYRVFVAVTRDQRCIRGRYIVGGPLADVVEMREAEMTWAELTATQMALMQVLDLVDSRAHTGVDVKENCVLLYASDYQALEAKLGALDLSLPDPVCLVQTGPYAEAPPVDPPPGIVFPRQRPPEGLGAEMTALIVGELLEVDGCLRVGTGGESHLIIWHRNYIVTAAEDGRLQIRNGSGLLVAEVGDVVSMGGGETPAVERVAVTEIPDHCGGPYWIAGSRVERQASE